MKNSWKISIILYHYNYHGNTHKITIHVCTNDSCTNLTFYIYQYKSFSHILRSARTCIMNEKGKKHHKLYYHYWLFQKWLSSVNIDKTQTHRITLPWFNDIVTFKELIIMSCTATVILSEYTDSKMRWSYGAMLSSPIGEELIT